MGATMANRLAALEAERRVVMISLLYHDIVAPGRESSSGFPGGDADRYKFDFDTFASHLEAISARSPLVQLTFDDGGVGAIEHAAGLIEQHGWHGIFFITTDYIGTRGFLDAAQIRALQFRGHLIGSHSCSHPSRMSACSNEQLFDEWHRSRHLLGDILGMPVTLASVPGGYYSRRVAEAADRAGIRRLYTSEPTQAITSVGECQVLGRFSVQQGDSPHAAAALAAADRLPHWRLKVFWNLKKGIKAIGGEQWIRLRRRWLRRSSP